MMAALHNAVPDGMPWVGALIAIGACLGMLIRSWSILRKVELDAVGTNRKLEVEADITLSPALLERIASLEAKIEAERVSCDERIARIEERHDAAMASLEMELQVHRHDRNNLKQCFDALLMLSERHPEKVSDNIAAVKEMRAEGEKQLAVERAAIPVVKGRRR